MSATDRSKRDPDVAHRLAQFTRRQEDHGVEIIPPANANIYAERDFWRASARHSVASYEKYRAIARRQSALIDTYDAELATANETIGTLEDAVREAIRASTGWTTGALLLWMLLAFCAGMVFSAVAV